VQSQSSLSGQQRQPNASLCLEMMAISPFSASRQITLIKRVEPIAVGASNFIQGIKADNPY